MFLLRRAAAYQAYYEHQPLRPQAIPNGPTMQIYRRVPFGNLVEFNVLDTRQFRSDQACRDGTDIGCAEALLPQRSSTGAPQEQWLMDGLARSHARWNVLAQQVFFSQRDLTAGPQQGFSMDAWDGCRASRDRILAGIIERRVDNVMVLTGDVHANLSRRISTIRARARLAANSSARRLRPVGMAPTPRVAPLTSWPITRTSSFITRSAATSSAA